ncbi:hypothetical protein J41TS12_11750 [Paenibacillus antibioticophila]|uniref:Uncharacterized protein n=1 Tax=Paenibacillus antibioticophila TaxID=1274374 RepID=A0A919XQX7_9BACL|nr:hypothetical protein [Paenibacillus antibioticophila]GIO36314.1 hypothetical protein J41TS12_11750 [Paenibacillus antibioticophila]
MKVLLVIIAFFGIAAVDLPDMIRNKQWRNLAIYSAIFLSVFTFGILVASDITVPSPIKAIQVIYRDVLGLSFKAS